MKAILVAIALAIGTLLSGCATVDSAAAFEDVGAVTHTVDIYITDQGFFVITERGSDNSIAYRFNTDKIYKTNQTEGD